METSMTENPHQEHQFGMPEKLSAWRDKLGEKARKEPKFRFYSLYGLVTHLDTLKWAWTLVKRNHGAPGVDGMDFAEIEEAEGGVEYFLKFLQEELAGKRYRAQAVRRVYIEKENGKERPLGIPTIRDRVVQAAVKLILEPIFEADFNDCSYGYRPRRGAKDAVEAIARHVKAGKTEVYDADLSGYFDTIPHDKLISAIRMRVVDGGVLGLIRQWLCATIVESDGKRKDPRGKGTPQGGVISPLLSNIYLHWFEVFAERESQRTGLEIEIVRYADDFVILAKQLPESFMKFVEETLEKRMGLKVNREKTGRFNLGNTGQTLCFLGYALRFDRDLKGRPWKYLNVFPSAKSLKRERQKLLKMTDSHKCFTPIPELIKRVNVQMKGWARYYAFGYPAVGYREINRYARRRMTIHLKRRSQRKYRTANGKSFYQELSNLGLVYLK